MEKVSKWIFLIIGILFLLPLISVETGIWGPWIIAIGFLLLGLLPFFKK